MSNHKVVSVNVPSITPDQARETMFHHLGLACAYFDATPASMDENLEELYRVFGKDDRDKRYQAVFSFIDTLGRGSAVGFAKTLDPRTPPPPAPPTMAPSKARQGERPLTPIERTRIAAAGLDIRTALPAEAGKVLGLNLRRQGRGYRVVFPADL